MHLSCWLGEKNSLNLLAIVRLQFMRSFPITNDGLVGLFDFPLKSLIRPHVFLGSVLHFSNFLPLYDFFAICLNDVIVFKMTLFPRLQKTGMKRQQRGTRALRSLMTGKKFPHSRFRPTNLGELQLR